MLRFFLIFLVMAFSQIDGAFAVDPTPPGMYRNNGGRRDCQPGCYCKGHSGKGKWWFINDIKNGCEKRWDKVTKELSSSIGVYLCPTEFSKSAKGAKSIEDCYYQTSGGTKVYHKTVNCAVGYYLPANSTTCQKCSTGYTCAGYNGLPSGTEKGRTAKTYKCAAGQYLPAAKETCVTCPVNNYCSGGSFKYNATASQGLTKCPQGKVTLGKTGQTAASACQTLMTSCSAGNYLDAANNKCVACPAGFSCPGGAAPRAACPTEFPKSDGNASSESDCYYVSGSTKVYYKKIPCIQGTYLPANSNSCVQCPKGYNCPGTSPNYPSKVPLGSSRISISCEAGKYLSKGAIECNTTCPTNHYCGGGTYDYSDAADQGKIACPNGTSTDGKTGQSSKAQCLDPSQIIKECPAGEYAEKGTECMVCISGYYCPAQNKGKSACPNGFTKSAAGATVITDCYYGNNVYYKKSSCPEGQYLPANSNTCKACPAGYNCTGYNGYPSASDQGNTPKSITCAAGKFLGAGKQTCDTCPADHYCEGGTYSFNPTSAQGKTECTDGKITYDETGKTKPADCKVVPTSCAAGEYLVDRKCQRCSSGHYCPGGVDQIPCPASEPSVWHEPSAYPDTYYAVDGEDVVQIKSTSYVVTSGPEGNKKASDCTMVYHLTNKRGNLTNENVKYNPDSGKYDVGGDVYYTSANPGFYLSEKYSENYCSEKASERYMRYRHALLCPTDKWCPGVKQTPCTAGTYEAEVGKKEVEEVECAKGSYLPANTNTCALCDTSKYDCPGSKYTTTHRHQGRYKTFTQAQLLYGPSGIKPLDPADSCWGVLSQVGFKNCVLGISDSE